MNPFDYQYPTSWIGLPRHVPLSVRLRLLFGGVLTTIGWAVWGIGMIFFWIFALHSDLTGWYVFSGNLATVQGTITGTRKTHATVGGKGQHSKRRVYAHDYRFEHQGQTYQGTSYKTGQPYPDGRKVDVEFPAGRPAVSRIVDMRSAVFPAAAGLVGVIPFVGLLLLAIGFLRGFRLLRLLKHGQLTTGRRIASRRTNARINGRPVYVLTFEFQAEDGWTHEAKVRTHRTAELRDDEEERLLYLPWKPKVAALLDHLPGAPMMDEAGEIHADRVGGTLLVMIIPAVAITVHSLVAAVLFL